MHNYENSQLLSISKTIQQQNNSLKIINQSILRSLLGCFYQTVGNSLCSNIDIAYLPSDDRTGLLHTAVANTICIAGQLIDFDNRSINDELL